MVWDNLKSLGLLTTVPTCALASIQRGVLRSVKTSISVKVNGEKAVLVSVC